MSQAPEYRIAVTNKGGCGGKETTRRYGTVRGININMVTNTLDFQEKSGGGCMSPTRWETITVRDVTSYTVTRR